MDLTDVSPRSRAYAKASPACICIAAGVLHEILLVLLKFVVYQLMKLNYSHSKMIIILQLNLLRTRILINLLKNNLFRCITLEYYPFLITLHHNSIETIVSLKRRKQVKLIIYMERNYQKFILLHVII